MKLWRATRLDLFEGVSFLWSSSYKGIRKLAKNEWGGISEATSFSRVDVPTKAKGLVEWLNQNVRK